MYHLGKICFKCWDISENLGTKTYERCKFRIPGKSYALYNIDSELTYAKKITAVNFTSKEANYHGIYRVKHQTETESTLEGQKVNLTQSTILHNYNVIIT